jgi:hypothetical protein
MNPSPERKPDPLPITPETIAASLGEQKKRWFQLWKPSEFLHFSPPDDFVLMGDSHLTRGGITVLSGHAGVGKSRATLALAVAGARKEPWMGHMVHAHFRTLVMQCENGPFRLKQELTEVMSKYDLDDWIRITPPPALGLPFREAGFREQLRESIEEFRPGLIILDPWNRTADGDKQGDYREALEAVFSCMPENIEERPAIVVIHHNRKKNNDHMRKGGRDLLHDLSGSYQIGSAARCVFMLEAGSNDTSNEVVVLTCCKNNDGREGSPSAWLRGNGQFAPAPEFDLESFLTAEPQDKSRKPRFSAIADALRGMSGETKTQAVNRLVNAGVCATSTGYRLLADYPQYIVEDSRGRLYWNEDGA